jgi:hypothetical protein
MVREKIGKHLLEIPEEVVRLLRFPSADAVEGVVRDCVEFARTASVE